MRKFNVTFEIVTPESAEYGEAESRGFIGRDMALRDAVAAFHETRTSQVDGVTAIEPNDSRIDSARWTTIINGMEYLTGACESRSIHLPESLTGATRRRLCRLLGVDVRHWQAAAA